MNKDQIYLGIDFGTSNIKIATWNFKDSSCKPVKLDKSQASSDCKIKNVVAYKKEMMIWGSSALDNAKTDEANSVINIKKKMEKPLWSQFIPALDIEKTAVDVITDIMQKIKEEAEKQKANNQKIQEVVVTVPVHYSEIQKNKIKKAITNAGMIPHEILLEPVAASIAYSLHSNADESGQKTVLFDFGGGTIDISIFEINQFNNHTEIEILNSIGILFGGTDIDDLIFKKLVLPECEFKDVFQDEKDIEAIQAKIRIINMIEIGKEDIFSNDDEDDAIQLYATNIYYDKNISMEIPKSKIIDLFNQIELDKKITDALKTLLVEKELKKSDVSLVKLVGGCSRIKYIQDLINHFFGKEIIDFDEDKVYNAVSFGACQYLVNSLDQSLNLKVKNRIAFNIFFKVNQNDFKEIVEKNSSYEFFSTIRQLPDYSIQNKGIELYQKRNSSDSQPIFIGKINFDPVSFSGKIYYKAGTDRHGEIVCKLFDENNPDEPKLILKPSDI